MIWHHTDPTVGHIEQCLRANRETAGLGSDEVREMAVAVSCFCGDTLTRQGVKSEILDLYIARALWGAGHGDRAYHYLAGAIGDAKEREAIGNLLSLDGVHPMLWPAAMQGLIRYSRWTAADNERIWMIDLERLDPDPVFIELSFFPALRQLICALAPVWEPTRGKGLLGVRESRAFSRRRHRSIPDYCRDVLEGLADRRGWGESPGVLRVNICGV